MISLFLPTPIGHWGRKWVRGWGVFGEGNESWKGVRWIPALVEDEVVLFNDVKWAVLGASVTLQFAREQTLTEFVWEGEMLLSTCLSPPCLSRFHHFWYEQSSLWHQIMGVDLAGPPPHPISPPAPRYCTHPDSLAPSWMKEWHNMPQSNLDACFC